CVIYVKSVIVSHGGTIHGRESEETGRYSVFVVLWNSIHPWVSKRMFRLGNCGFFILHHRLDERGIAYEKHDKGGKAPADQKEAKATFALFFLCFVWHVGFAYGLNHVDIRIWNLPLWWVVSTPGVFIVA
ncbi:MAG: YhdT family protein, partial [Firmicutes bacterium]|nr:YhdT family protein [Bacillota bacterium]